MVKRFLAAMFFCGLGLTPALRAQAGPEVDHNELQVWTGGGHALNGSTSDTGIWNVGLRYGWVLTNPIGPGPLKGRFEYAVDVVPAFLVVQNPKTAYGFGLIWRSPIGPLRFDWAKPIDGGPTRFIFGIGSAF